jgi:hypothetical protein
MREVWPGPVVETPHLLWRYCKPERFVSSLKTRTLHFAAAHQFEDPFEGAVAIQRNSPSVDPRYAEPEPVESAFRELTRLTKISCWHIADFESDAMWKLYASSSKGVAITTTRSRLGRSLVPFRLEPEYGYEEPFAGPVRYVDLLNERLAVGMIERFFHKHRAFEWEREYRVAISLRSAEEFGCEVPRDGIKVSFDPDALLEQVILGPSLASDQRQDILTACEEVGITDRLEDSGLLSRPRYI